MKRYKLIALGLMCAFAFSNAAYAAAKNPDAPAELTPEEAAQAEQEERDLIEAAQAMRRSGLVQFNFKEMELVKFVRFMSELLRENIIVPPNINAKITIISPRPSSITESRQIMLSTLQMYGFSLQDMGSYSIVRQGGNSPSPTVGRGRGGPGYGEETVTYIMPLDYVTVESVIPAIQQSFGNALIVIPVGNGRDILLQGRATDVNKAVDLLRKMDTPQSARVSRTFNLKYGDPATVANQLNAIAQAGGPLQGLSTVADASSRKIIVVGPQRAIERAEKIVKELDVDSKVGDFHIYKLKNIDATAAADQVSKVLAASSLLQPTQEGKYPTAVVPDVATNSLIFAASQRQYDAMVKILDQLDVQPKQVLLRGFIAEINVTNLDRAGIDWNFLGGRIWDQFMMGGSASLGEGTVPSQYMTWFSDLMKREELVDRNGSTYSVTNYEPLALMYATIDLLKKYDAVNVLSVPRLMCTDNKESSFQVGQVIPVLKGSASDLTNLGAVQQNYDYKDTGLTLTVTPHIRSGNLVVLDIKQTTEDLLSSTTSTTPITAKRQVNTSVIVADGETIILGGIVKETERSLRRRVPGLSYIPLIGNLFQKVSKEKEKVDFVIFLTPEIIEDPREMRRVTMAATGFAEAAGYPADYPATRTAASVNSNSTPDGTPNYPANSLANYPANRIAEYQEPTALASGDMNFNTQNLFPKGSRQRISDIEISPVESDIDRRFRELYKKSVKKQ